MHSSKYSNLLDRLLFLLLGALVVCLITNVALVAILLHGIGLQRIVPMDRAEHVEQYHHDVFSPDDLPRLHKVLDTEGITKLRGEARVLATLQWVMSRTDRVEQNFARGGWAVLQSVQGGRGMLCASTAELFRDALLALDVPARMVFLFRDIFGGDSHATVEAWVDGKWRLYDPTFHVAVKSVDGHRVGISDAQRWFVERKGEPVQFEFLGEVKYPARLDRYYVRYEALLNNVFIELQRGSPLVRYVPWARPWVGPIWGYPRSGDERLRSGHYDTYSCLYHGALVFLPSLVAALAIAILGLAVARARGKASVR